MKIYIASSWKNQHAVELLTAMFRSMDEENGHVDVLSWVENNYGEDHGPDKGMDFEDWVRTPAAMRSFEYDTQGASHADLVVYLGPAGTDAWAEIGIAYGSGRPIIGLWAKGEPSGLMRHLVSRWFTRVDELLLYVDEMRVDHEAAKPRTRDEIREAYGSLD